MLMAAVATTQAFIGEDADNLTEYYVECGKPIPDLSMRAGICRFGYSKYTVIGRTESSPDLSGEGR
jgi:hypothetical protein